MTNPPPLVSAAADVLQQEGVIDVPRAELRPGNLSRVTDEGAGRQPAVISVMTPPFRRSQTLAASIRDLGRTGRLPKTVDEMTVRRWVSGPPTTPAAVATPPPRPGGPRRGAA